MIDQLNVVDVYRQYNPKICKYTWRRPNPIKQARLDYFLLSENLSPNVQNSNIESGYRSDNSITVLFFKFNEFKNGIGLWKFNNSLLHDLEYFDLINKHIIDIKIQYALPIYNLNNITNISDADIQFQINYQLFLETLLIEIGGKTFSYRKQNSNR